MGNSLNLNPNFWVINCEKDANIQKLTKTNKEITAKNYRIKTRIDSKP